MLQYTSASHVGKFLLVMTPREPFATELGFRAAPNIEHWTTDPTDPTRPGPRKNQ